MAWNEPGNNNRDPWSQGPGGKRGDAPPDLNELLKRFKNRWGGRDGKGLGGVPVLLIVALLVLVWLLFGFYTVSEQEQALVIRFGTYARTDGPGLHWRLPPFEHVKKIDVSQPRQASVQGELLTKDQNLVDVTFTAQFRVATPEDSVFNITSPDDTLRLAAQSALQQVVAQYSVDDVLNTAQQAIALRTRQMLQQILDNYHCGLQVTDASLSRVQPPEAVQPAFFDTIRAAEDRKRAHNDAQAYADSRVPTARGDAARSVTEAQAYSDQVIARAKGDAARFDAVLQQYRKSPQVTRKRLYLDTMSEIYAKSAKVLVDVDKGNPNFTVPLQELLKGLSVATPPPASVAPPAAAPAAGAGNGASGNNSGAAAGDSGSAGSNDNGNNSSGGSGDSSRSRNREGG
jgi:modulator of FtsH protease HflK